MTTRVETATNGGPARPHGGRLVERWLDPDEREAAERLPALRLTPAEAADLRAIATGAYSPLEGFMGRAAHEACAEAMHTDDGTLWPIPVCLGLPDEVELRGGMLALREAEGRVAGVLEVTEVFERDREREAKLVYGTDDPAHPGVARVLGSPARAVAGPVRAVKGPAGGPAGSYALTPAQTRAAFAERGWGRIAAFQTRNPVHRAHEYLLKCALEGVRRAAPAPPGRPDQEGDVPVEVRLRAYEAVLSYFPAERVVLAALVAPMRYAGPREAVLHALVRKNHGRTHFIVGRDHAASARRRHLRSPGLILRTPPRTSASPCFRQHLLLPHLRRWPRRRPAPTRESPTSAFPGPRCARCWSPGNSPPGVHPPRGGGGAHRGLPGRRRRAERKGARMTTGQSWSEEPGFVLWLTGLSGAGKSTLARTVTVALADRGHRVELLDGDEVRTNLCQGLGFSRADRDTNIARIGYVAGKLAKHGVAVVVAAISPYREGGAKVRAAVPNFVEVFVDAPWGDLRPAGPQGALRQGDRRRDRQLHRRP